MIEEPDRITFKWNKTSQDESQDIYVCYKNGIPCPAVQLDSKKAKRLADLDLILWDLQLARKDIKITPSLPDSEENEAIRRSLWISSTITYARCFANSKGRLVLNKGDCFRDNAENLKYHEQLMEARHQYLAHADDSEYEQISVFVALDPNLQQKGVLDVFPSKMKANNFGDQTRKIIMKLIEDLFDHVSELFRQCLASIREDVDSMEIDELYRSAIYFEKVER